MTWSGAVAKSELATLITTALASQDVMVVYGAPSPWLAPDIVALGDMVTERERPRLGVRTVDEVHEIQLTVSCARAGGIEQQKVCTDRAATLLTAIETALRAVAGENLSATAAAAGITLAHIVGRLTTTETPHDAADDIAVGRWCAITATVQVTARRV